MFVLTLQGLRIYQCGFVIQRRQCSSLFPQFALAMTVVPSSANVELPSAWSKCQCVLISQPAIDEAPKQLHCVSQRPSLEPTDVTVPPAPAKEKTLGGISDTVKEVLWYVARDELRVWEVAREHNMRLDVKPGLHAGDPRESRDIRHTGSHLSRTSSRLCPLSSCAS